MILVLVLGSNKYCSCLPSNVQIPHTYAGAIQVKLRILFKHRLARLHHNVCVDWYASLSMTMTFGGSLITRFVQYDEDWEHLNESIHL